MGIKDIAFNPYEENHEYIVDAIEECLANAQPEVILEELAVKIFYDNSVGWGKVLPLIFEKHGLSQFIPSHYRRVVQEHRDDLIPKYTYLITSLISSNLLSGEFLNKDLVKEITDDEAKYILFSFLASWDLQRALDLDFQFTSKHFQHMVQANAAPTKDLILNAENDAFYSIVQTALVDSKVQFHFYQTIQKIIKGQSSEELRRLESFVERCCTDKHEHMIDFVCDLFELTSVQGFLSTRWEFTLTERLYKRFAQNHENMTQHARTSSLKALNRLKKRQNSNFAIAARHQINKLSESDRKTILEYVEEVSSADITDYEESYSLTPRNGWEWKDYAFSLVRHYKEKHPNEQAVDVFQLGKDLGINILVKTLETEEFDACLVRDGTLKLPTIVVNASRKSTGRIHFSIAHEIAHAVIPQHAKNTYFCFLEDVTESSRFVMDKQLENEANAFASYVILPERDFKHDCSRLDFHMGNVRRMSNKYGASMVLVAKRWVETSNLEIGMVFSTNGVVDWACTSDTFPFKWVSHVDKLSTVFDVIESQDREPIRKTVHSTKWFETDYPRYILQEESYKIFDDKVLTLLQVMDEE